MQCLIQRILLLAGLLALAGCGAGSTTGRDGNTNLEPAPAPALTGLLPSPASLLERGVSFTEQSLMRNGADFEISPVNLVSAAGTGALFSPAYGASADASGLAYSMYSFGVENYARDLNVQLTWAAAPANGTTWLALANFDTNRWELLAVPSNNRVAFTDLADYTSPAPDFALYAAVLMTGSAARTLDRIRVGTQPNVNGPTAMLQADVTTGPAPLAVNLDASASSATAPSAIVKYEFDFDEGAGFEDYGTTSTANHVYNTDGSYTPLIRVTDVFGKVDSTGIVITVSTGGGGYDEVEDNDTALGAMAFPALPQVDFTGNIGPGGPNDGDAEDYYRFSATAGEVITVSIYFDPSVFIFTFLQNGNGTDVAQLSAPGTMSYTVTAGDPPPFRIYLICFSGSAADYSLDVALSPPTVQLIATPSIGALPLATTLDASGSTDVAPGTIVGYEFDPEGDGSFLPQQVGATFSANYAVEGAYAPRVRVTDDDGNQVIGTGSVIAGTPFDEVENNDSVAVSQSITMPMTNFTGSLGSGFGYASYDGDDDDYFSFPANPGDEVQVTLTLDSSTGNLDMYLLDNMGSVWNSSTTTTDTEQFTFPFPTFPTLTGPFRIRVVRVSGYSDYTINAIIQ